jgi:hypothetical protein
MRPAARFTRSVSPTVAASCMLYTSHPPRRLYSSRKSLPHNLYCTARQLLICQHKYKYSSSCSCDTCDSGMCKVQTLVTCGSWYESQTCAGDSDVSQVYRNLCAKPNAHTSQHCGNYMYHWFWSRNSAFTPHGVYICFVWLPQYSNKRLVFVMDTWCVLCEVRIGFELLHCHFEWRYGMHFLNTQKFCFFCQSSRR